MKLPFYTYDVFTSRKFAGNPLAIVEQADVLSTEQMQTIAREFNLSETIFVRTAEDAANTASVRIFFPTAEIPFAGHPTIGCAIHLAAKKYKEGCSFETTIRLEEVAGLVPVKVSRIGDVPRAQFTAPVTPFAVDQPLPSSEEAGRALGLDPSEIGFGGHALGYFQGGPRFLYIPLHSRDALVRARPLEPHWTAMLKPIGCQMGYLYVAGGDDPATTYRGRMFAPDTGTYEDSATAILAAQLLAAENPGDGTHRWKLEQGYEMGRPSDLWLEADVAGAKLVAVRVAGQAVQISSGVLDI